jgi:5-methylthioadenosine/S-adenosylhomocysteine deaminase
MAMTTESDNSAHSAGTVTIVRAGHLLTMGDAGDVADGAVAFDAAGVILAVGTSLDVAASFPGATIVGEQHDIVLPGFVNAHDHLSEGLISGLGERMSLYEWLKCLIKPIGPHLTRELAQTATLLKTVEMLQSGVTCVNDMFVHSNTGSNATLGVVDGLQAAGLRGISSFGAHDLPGWTPVAALMSEHEALAERCGSSPLVDFRLGIATLNGASDDLLDATVAAGVDNGWKLHTHLAEVREEITESRVTYGMNSLERADRHGILDLDPIFAHCVWVNEADIETLRRRGLSIVHNPLANMILASGVCPVPRLRAAGMAVGLGTDGSGSNDSHDMLQVMKMAALMQKVHHLDPSVLNARDVVRMATIEGARALRLDASIGSLDVGKQADVVRFTGLSPTLAYIHDPYQQLVYCAAASAVSDVWVAGVHVVAEGEVTTVDIGTVVADAR